MLKRGEAYDAVVWGARKSAPICEENLKDVAVRGGMLRGAIRQLHYDADGSLLLLAGLGVRRLDPDSLEQTGHWLADQAVEGIYGTGPTLWVVIERRLHRAAFGAPLGEPLATLTEGFRHTHIANDHQFAAVLERGVMLVDTEGTVTRFVIDPDWYAALWSASAPDIALLSPSGKTIGASHDGRYLMLWDVASGEVLCKKEHSHGSTLLDDDRYVQMETFSSTLHHFRADEYSPFLKLDKGGVVVVGDEVAVGNAEGNQVLLRRSDLSVLAKLEGVEKEYGSSTSLALIARSPKHTASYAVMSGILRVTSAAGTTEQPGWSGSPNGLSVSEDGTRALIWREWGPGRADVIDVDAGTLNEIRGGDGLISPGLTPDGQRLVLPCGNNLRGRSVNIAQFDGSESTEVHTTRQFVKGFVGFRDDCYALLSYTLSGQGEVALYRAGIKRVLARVKHNKEQPWRFAIGHGAQELAISWKSETIRYDMTKRPKPVETLSKNAVALALGPVGHLAIFWYDSGEPCLSIQRPDAPSFDLPIDKPRGRAVPVLAFSTDGTLVFVGRSDGVLEIRRTTDGVVCRELPLFVDGFVSLVFVGEALWAMGGDGRVAVLGV